MKNRVFVHVPRTGGSSVWHSLAHLAPRFSVGVIDIYYQCQLNGGTLAGAKDVVRDIRREIGDAPCLFHHHTSEPVYDVFSLKDTIFATVLRDPVDRFISAVVHYRNFVTTHSDLKFIEYHAMIWGRDFFDYCVKPDVEIGELLDLAATQKYFRTYYTTFFASLFDMAETSAALPVRIREVFSVIGRFESLAASYSDIAVLFGMGAAELDHIVNMGNTRPLVSDSDRVRYAAALHVDYELLDVVFGRKLLAA
jgi:hypothetical protein